MIKTLFCSHSHFLGFFLVQNCFFFSGTGPDWALVLCRVSSLSTYKVTDRPPESHIVKMLSRNLPPALTTAINLQPGLWFKVQLLRSSCSECSAWDKHASLGQKLKDKDDRRAPETGRKTQTQVDLVVWTHHVSG